MSIPASRSRTLSPAAAVGMNGRRQRRPADRPRQPAAPQAYDFAFQMIVDLRSGAVFSYEALLRAPGGTSAKPVLDRVLPGRLHAFDAEVRSRVVQAAQPLGLGRSLRPCLNLNAFPRALLDGETGLDGTLAAARACGFDLRQLIVEITEVEPIDDPAAFAQPLQPYRELGVRFAIDDFGAGYAGLCLLADWVPDFIKLDMALTRGIDAYPGRQAIVRGMLQVCRDLGVEVIAEGVETAAESAWFARQGVFLQQGFLFGRGRVGAL